MDDSDISAPSYATPTQRPPPLMAAPPPPPTQIAVAPKSSMSNYNIAFYMSVIFVFFILTYAAVSYSRDVQNRNNRSHRHNLGAYKEYALALAKRCEHGHAKEDDGKTEEIKAEKVTSSTRKPRRKRTTKDHLKA